MEKTTKIEDMIAYINDRLDECFGARHYIHKEGRAFTVFRKVGDHMYVSYSFSENLVEQMIKSEYLRDEVMERIRINLNAGELDLLRMCKQA